MESSKGDETADLELQNLHEEEKVEESDALQNDEGSGLPQVRRNELNAIL